MWTCSEKEAENPSYTQWHLMKVRASTSRLPSELGEKIKGMDVLVTSIVREIFGLLN